MLLKKLIISIILIFCASISVCAADIPTVSARSAVLINAETKEVIFEKNAYEKLSMASTTKIMTGIIAVESGRLTDIVTANNIQTEGTSIGLEDGYKLILEDLVWGMMLESGNDAAELVADYLAGNKDDFAVLMNNKAQEFGMLDSNFVTASGLDSDGHYSTAYDMALLGAYAVNNPLLRKICSTETKRVEFIEPAVVRYFSNHNRLLTMCDGVFGIKTGFTKKSGRCLVSACERGEVELIAVTLNAANDWNDHIKLYDYGFDVCISNAVYIRVPDTVKVYGGTSDSVTVTLSENPVEISQSCTSEKITQRVLIPEFIYAPVKSGDVLGKVQLVQNGKVICERSILCGQTVDAIAPLPHKRSFFSKIKDLFN